METIRFLDEQGTFAVDMPENYTGLYFPLAGLRGLKSAVTPDFGGDAKLDQEHFVLEPVSVENLHNNRSTRNFWCCVDGQCWSATGVSAQQEAARFTPTQDKTTLTAGFMWQTVTRESASLHLKAEVTDFVPPEENAEWMRVRITNTASIARTVTPVAAVPLYGRSADNLRDHRNVTSMLHRIVTTKDGVLVTPTMSFDEKGHRRNRMTYYVTGVDGDGNPPESFYPAVQDFLGEGGSFTHPRAVLENHPGLPAGTAIAGKEAMGGLRFPSVTLAAGESAEYLLKIGTTENTAEIFPASGYEEKLADTRDYWKNTVNVWYQTGDARFDIFMRWVSFQPYLRRIYGCSYLPHHDYGRGGRGWRDLWQDCLSLLLMEPEEVRDMIVTNFGGVRVDGTNATIIGQQPGVFVADRNGIPRVWMDHALWPLMTTKLYLDQTGDNALLLETAPYFKDGQTCRGTAHDEAWTDAEGMNQKNADGSLCMGTVLEHLLVENLTAFYEVGEHNILRLRGADWNDALDMAWERGESVAFTCAYAGNLRNLAALLRRLPENRVEVLAELPLLLSTDETVFENIDAKKQILQRYTDACRHTVSGSKVTLSAAELAEDLEAKADWLMAFLRRQEWMPMADGEGWFNSYYDDSGRRVEGVFGDKVRMMLTGQVFAIMSGTAADEQIPAICKAADRYLYDRSIGGYRLNTDFEELKFDLGRMFGFAYGEKENGAVFSHMTVMFANALYRRGFAHEGYKALQTLAEQAMDFEKSKIYPGIPEYFNSEGRGVYHYLTGAASWYMMTVMTEVFGVHGEAGDLVIRPRLLATQFDERGRAAIAVRFAGKDLWVEFENPHKLDYGQYTVTVASVGTLPLNLQNGQAVLPRATLTALEGCKHTITVTLG